MLNSMIGNFRSQQKYFGCRIYFVALFAATILAAPDSSANDSGADGTTHTGVKTGANQGSKPGKVLNGSAQHSQSLNPSVKLFSPSSAAQPGRSNSANYAGQTIYPFRRMVYIPNAPVTPFPRERHDYAVRPRPVFVPPAKIAQTESAPQAQAAAAPTNGLMTWVPGYGSTIVPQIQARTAETGVHGMLGGGDRLLSVRPLVPEFRSTPRLLTELLAPKEKRSANWNEWYKRVCKTVYDQWLLDDTGPGKACIHVTVWSSRDIECKIVDFTPAAGAARNVDAESSFRQAALRAVRSLDRCLVLEFPAQFLRNQVGFDLDVSRSVDGPFGCQVIAANGTEDSMITSAVGK